MSVKEVKEAPVPINEPSAGVSVYISREKIIEMIKKVEPSSKKPNQ